MSEASRSPPPPYASYCGSTYSIPKHHSSIAVSVERWRSAISDERRSLLPTPKPDSKQYSPSANIPKRICMLIFVVILLVVVLAGMAIDPRGRCKIGSITACEQVAEYYRHARNDMEKEIALYKEKSAECEHELAKWTREREKLERDQRRRREDREREERERQRRRDKEERQQKRLIAGTGWDAPSPHECTRYGTRRYTANLLNVPGGDIWKEACESTAVQIHERVLSQPHFCEQNHASGTVHGTWLVEYEEPGCTPYWGSFKDNGCTADGSKTRRFSSRLWDLRKGEDWDAMCASTPAEIMGNHFQGPTTCENTFFSGIWGIWEIEDMDC